MKRGCFTQNLANQIFNVFKIYFVLWWANFLKFGFILCKFEKELFRNTQTKEGVY